MLCIWHASKLTLAQIATKILLDVQCDMGCAEITGVKQQRGLVTYLKRLTTSSDVQYLWFLLLCYPEEESNREEEKKISRLWLYAGVVNM